MTADPHLRAERVAERTATGDAWVGHIRKILRGEAPPGSWPDGLARGEAELPLETEPMF